MSTNIDIQGLIIPFSIGLVGFILLIWRGGKMLFNKKDGVLRKWFEKTRVNIR